MKPRDVIKKLSADGWHELPRGSTSHRQYGHAVKSGKVTVTIKGGKEYAERDIRGIIEKGLGGKPIRFSGGMDSPAARRAGS